MRGYGAFAVCYYGPDNIAKDAFFRYATDRMRKTAKRKIRMDVLTIFPEMCRGYFGSSILKRGQEKKLLDLRAHDLRKWSDNKHHKVDDKPYGGGPGMVMQVGPFYRALKSLQALKKKRSASPHPRISASRIILMSAKGKQFTHEDAIRLSKYDRLVFLCGRYEGVDERVAERLADEEICIGPYVLTGGELPAMVVADAVARHIPGVLGDAASLASESHAEEGVTEYPQYTRPEVFAPAKGAAWKVPPVLLSGDHKKIEEWRRKSSGRSR